MQPIPKSISAIRDRSQSRLLLWVVGPLLVLGAVMPLLAALRLSLPLWPLAMPLILSAVFASGVYLVRAATLGATAIGFLICFILAQSPLAWSRYLPDQDPHLLIGALLTVFVLTFAATRYKQHQKEIRGLSESRRGRSASQIVANLGIAGLFAAAGRYDGCIAALAEAAADTVSSEIGQASGIPARLITTGRRVPSGTDGGITLPGTIAGLIAAAIVVAASALRHPLWPTQAGLWAAAAAGFLFDSLLGATIERRGWLGNDLVNFSSTLLAALLATLLH
ncbi:DUF92 domain-containing protein [Edaphobacter albus]|uniref:DUF92 domain-containing protein n=1 Tax=Edaphobacter sp. 4G125 TaxID=2763071 RepID=UPI001645AF04|nr:DUF92 domain-containing protein [Edaphobacter sp. 4G125]QNI38078.1 DUF92 domain-containing protein [Edaphobacter sp. 4G125]